MKQNRAVVTGMGSLTPAGLNVADTWRSLSVGTSCIDKITHFDTTKFASKIAGELKEFDPRQFLDAKEVRRTDRFCQIAIGAAKEAIEDAGLETGSFIPERAGVIVSSGIGGMQTIENETRKLLEGGPRKVSPFFIPMMIPDIAAGHISMRWNFRGPNYATTSACASSANGILDALRLIQGGFADIIIAGGAEASITQLGIAGFNAMKALSTRNDEPEKASRPFDLARDGFVMGEGAGVLVIENEEHARQRGARIYAEIAGGGLSADAYHLTAPAPDGIGAQRAMQNALHDASIKPADVDYVNAHGTSTPANDKNETKAVAEVFGEHASSLLINSTKSMIGHLLGASAAIEAIVCIKTINDNLIHPTINLDTPDPECFLNYTAHTAVTENVDIAISNSFGFGGHNVCLVFKSYDN